MYVFMMGVLMENSSYFILLTLFLQMKGYITVFISTFDFTHLKLYKRK